MSRLTRNRARKSPDARGQQLETLGVIIIAILIIALTVTRSWHHISWSAR